MINLTSKSMLLPLSLALLVGCGKTRQQDEPEPQIEPSKAGFNLSFHSKFAEQVEVIRAGTDHTLWIARSEKSSSDDEFSSQLEHRTLDGNLMDHHQVVFKER